MLRWSDFTYNSVECLSKTVVMMRFIIGLKVLLMFIFCTAFSNPIKSDDYVPCESGWYYFHDKCYRAEGREPSERLSWHEALAKCKSYGADLASIQSQEEQDFIAAYLLLNTSWWAWIGLNHLDKENFKWTDGSVFNYSYWHDNNPSYSYFGVPEDCVQLNMFPDDFATWNDRNCNELFAYICEKNANIEVSSQNPMYCSPEEGGGWKNKNSCYHVIQERKSWDDAENYCKQNYSGHLLTIHDLMEDYFLDLAIPDIKKDMWIGIKMENLRELKWTSGWFVAYESYSNNGKNITEGDCFARTGSKDWATIPCSKELPFICEVSKESPPVLKPPPIGARCPENQDYWRDFGGEYCYYFEATKVVTFDEANETCIRRGGHMASLHSQEEADILQPFFKYKQWSIHIGLHRKEEVNEFPFNDRQTFDEQIKVFESLDKGPPFKKYHGISGTFEWIDGTDLDYQNWSDGEPDNVEEPLFENWGGPDKVQEPCVEMWILTKKWNDIPCDKVDVGFVCSVKKILPKSIPVHETNIPHHLHLKPSKSKFPALDDTETSDEVSETLKSIFDKKQSSEDLAFPFLDRQTINEELKAFDSIFGKAPPLKEISVNLEDTLDETKLLNEVPEIEAPTFDEVQPIDRILEDKVPVFREVVL